MSKQIYSSDVIFFTNNPDRFLEKVSVSAAIRAILEHLDADLVKLSGAEVAVREKKDE